MGPSPHGSDPSAIIQCTVPIPKIKSAKNARAWVFSIAMGAEYLFYMKSIETHARTFLALIILPIGTVTPEE